MLARRGALPKDVFGITAMMTCVFNVVKAGLYACQDFQFMAQASLWVAWHLFMTPEMDGERLDSGCFVVRAGQKLSYVL